MATLRLHIIAWMLLTALAVCTPQRLQAQALGTAPAEIPIRFERLDNRLAKPFRT